MKRITALLMLVCLLLCACGKKQAAVETTDAPTTDAPTQAPATETTAEPTVETTEETEPPVYRNPLTGALLEEPWSGRVTAVIINNLRDALPQKGISQADVFYEIEVESSITRCLALFTDLTNVGVIGPIRSARSYFINLATAYDATLVHCGGSKYATNAQYDDSGEKVKGYAHINESEYGNYFFRDKERYEQQGYAWEHTLFTKSDKLQEIIAKKELDKPTELDFGLQFEEGVDLSGETANEVTITFKGTKKTVMLYDSATGMYQMTQHGENTIDGVNDQAVQFKNVLAIYADQWVDSSDGYHQFYDLIGSGDGYAAVNGKIVPLTWSRETVYDPFTYTLADGSPLTLDVGTTYVAVVGIKNPIAFE